MKSIKLFTEKVMPHFKDDVDTEVKKVSWSNHHRKITGGEAAVQSIKERKSWTCLWSYWISYDGDVWRSLSWKKKSNLLV
jgi:hypothetical protein